MADDDTRPTNDPSFRRAAGRRRGEPPVIEGAALDAAPGDAPGAPVASSGDASVPREEPVLFGSGANRAPGSRPSGPEVAAPPVPDAATVAADAPSDRLARAEAGAGAAPRLSDPPPPRRRSRFAPVALVLGLLVLGLLGTLAWLLSTEGQRSGATDPGLDALKARVNALEARPDRVGATRDDLVALGRRLDEREGALADATRQAADAEARVEALTGAVTAARADAASAKDDAKALRAQLPSFAAVEPSSVAPAVPPAAVSPADLARVDDKVSALDRTVATLAAVKPPESPPVDFGPVEHRLGDVEGKLVAAEQGLSVLRVTFDALPRTDLRPLQAIVGDLARRLAAAERDLAAPRPEDPALIGRLDAGAAAARAAEVAAVTQSLVLALDAGRPYGPELGALRALGSPEDGLAPIAPGAEGGVATLEALRARWAARRDEVRAVGQPEPAGSVLDRLAAGARGIVRVKRTDEPADDGSDAAYARVDDALARGDLAAALAGWDALPDANKRASRDWADAATARVRADVAAKALSARALAGIALAKG